MALKIAVCIKVSPNPEKYNLIQLDPVTKRLIRDGVESVISSVDLHAVELALQLKAKFGGTVTLVSMGPDSNEKQLREGLGYGCDEAVLISDRVLGGADTYATSYTLYKGLEKMGGFDLVLLGNASDDGATAHMPSQLGEWLGVPHLTDVIGCEMETEQSILAKKEVNSGVNTYEITLPAILGVAKRLNKVRHPNVMAIFAAKKKPFTKLTAADLSDLDLSKVGLSGSPTQTVGYQDTDFHRDCTELVGKDEEKAAELLKIIRSYVRV